MRKKKLLIVGGGYADIPLVKAGKQLGFYVITTGNRPADLGHHYSDLYIAADYSDPEAILDVAIRQSIDAICACSNDFSALSAAYVAERLGLPGHDSYATALTLHHKDRYRAFAQANGIATPEAKSFDSVDDALAYVESAVFPLIVKPVDLTGGKGVKRLDNFEDAQQAIELAFSISKTKRVVVEQFIEGTRHGFSAFLRDGRIAFCFSDNEHYYSNPYMVGAASCPALVPEQVLEKVYLTSERIAGLLGLGTGIFHVQYILAGTEPYIIEICRRSPGDLYTRFVQIATGVDYPSFIVRSSAGLDCTGIQQKTPNGFYMRHCVMGRGAGKVADIDYDESVRGNIIEEFMWWQAGDRIVDWTVDKLGIVFLRFYSLSEMLEKSRKMDELIRPVLID